MFKTQKKFANLKWNWVVSVLKGKYPDPRPEKKKKERKEKNDLQQTNNKIQWE